jgi:HSP20 family protein
MNAMIRSPEKRFGWDLFDDFDNVVNSFFKPVGSVSNGQALTPSLDIAETDKTYVLKAELPGVSKDDLDVSIKDGLLTINAESKFEHDEEKQGRLIRQERRYGKYVRSLRLGADVDESKVEADYRDGILTLTLPKAEVVQPRKIEVQIQ